MSEPALPTRPDVRVGELLGRADGRGRRRLQHAPRREVGQPVKVRLWLPLTPLWLLLSPFALLLAPFLWIPRQTRGMNPARALWVVGGLLMSMSGTLIHVEAPGAHVHIHIL